MRRKPSTLARERPSFQPHAETFSTARVVLSYAESGRAVRLMVRDGAGGFARARPSERPSEPGTGRGLGLAVSRGLAARMGASLTLDDGRGVLATLGVRRAGAASAVATEAGARRLEEIGRAHV